LRGPQPWQKHGFQCEKAVKQWRGPEAMAKEQKEAMRADLATDLADLCHQWPFSLANMSMPTSAKIFETE
jgi:hypothetical protein